MRLTIIRSSTCWTSSSRSISTRTRSTVEASAATRSACAGSDSHLPSRPATSRVAQLGLDHLGRHEVLPDERAEALAELVLLALDDRGVRDRDAQRMLEQRGHREPVGQRTDHARLRRRRRHIRPMRPRRSTGPTCTTGRSPWPRPGNPARRPSSAAGRGAVPRRPRSRRRPASRRSSPLGRRRGSAVKPPAPDVWSVCHSSIIRYDRDVLGRADRRWRRDRP